MYLSKLWVRRFCSHEVVVANRGWKPAEKIEHRFQATIVATAGASKCCERHYRGSKCCKQ